MKKILLSLMMTAMLLPLAASAAHGEHGGKYGKYMDRIATELQLTDEQRSQMQDVMKQQREKGKALRTETRTRINEILDDEQQAKMETMHAERKERWSERREQYRQREHQQE